MTEVDLVAQFLEELERVDVFTGLPKAPKPESGAEQNRRVRAELAQERWERRQAELPRERLQKAIDAAWERTLEAKRAEAERAEDPEAEFREMIWGPELRDARERERRRRQDELANKALCDEAMADVEWHRQQRRKGHD